MTSRYIIACALASSDLLLQSQAFALTCTPPQREVCYKGDCSCWDVSTFVGPDGKTVIQLKGEAKQAPNVLNQLKINPKDLLK